MNTDRILAGVSCFLMACILCCCSCDDTIPTPDMMKHDMEMACVSCSQTPPYFGCIPSLCAEVVPGKLCCVN